MDRDDVEIIDRKIVYDGYFRMDRYRLRHRLHDGDWSGEITRELFERGHAAALLPYDPALDVVVLIEQFRIGAYAAGWKPWLFEVVAGIIEPGETPDDVVRREAAEEAGLSVTDLVPIAEYLPSPGGTSETTALFCGRVDAARAGGIHGLADEGEDIEVSVHESKDIESLVSAGQIRNAASLIALQWFLLNRKTLRRRWG
jgi:ADP-ribose diphosphatase